MFKKTKNYVILILLSLSLLACNGEVNTTNPQMSFSISESKKSGLFKEEYKCIVTPDSIVQIGEAWIENLRFNKIERFMVTKEIGSSYQLIFEIKGSKNKIEEQTIEWNETGEYAGYRIGNNFPNWGFVSIDSLSDQDSIILTVTCCGTYPKTNEGLPKPTIGTLTFVKKK